MKMLYQLHGVYPKVQISLHAGELAMGLVPPEAYGFTFASRSSGTRRTYWARRGRHERGSSP